MEKSNSMEHITDEEELAMVAEERALIHAIRKIQNK